MSFINGFGNRFIVPVAVFLSQNRYLKAAKNGIDAIFPFLATGGLFLLLAYPALLKIDFANYGVLGNFLELWKLVAEEHLQTLLLPVYLTVGLSAVWVAIAVGYRLAKHYKLPKLQLGLISGAAVVLCAAPENVIVVMKLSAKAFMKDAPFAIIPDGLIGAQGVLPAIIIAFLVVEIARVIGNAGSRVKLPKSVPPAVVHSIVGLIIAGLTLIVIFIVNETCQASFNLSFIGCLWLAVNPILYVVGSLPFILLIVLFSQWTWFIGLHGCNTTMHLIQPFMTVFILLNAELVMNGQATTHAFTDPFRNYTVIIGGNGATLGLVILTRLMTKSQHLQNASKRAIGSVTFNINELVTFGYPVIQNPRLMVPYLVVPVINAAVAYFCISYNMVGAAFCMLPWTMPAPIGAFLSTLDYRAVLLVLGLIILDALIYLPFLLKFDRELVIEERSGVI
ncbi:MAG: PTS transporter subunit EIIC [Negativicutes bacterium]|jgi:PTS system cellobiose-specific IIC component